MRPKSRWVLAALLFLLIFYLPKSCLSYTEEEKKSLAYMIRQAPEMSEIAGSENDDELIRRYEEIQRRKLGYEKEPSRFDILAQIKKLKEKADYEEGLRFYVHLIFVFLAALFVLSMLANLVGLQQKVFWAFICAALGTILIDVLLNFFFGLGCGFYILFFALFIGMAFALYVQTKK